jgi:hypothetical protein
MGKRLKPNVALEVIRLLCEFKGDWTRQMLNSRDNDIETKLKRQHKTGLTCGIKLEALE